MCGYYFLYQRYAVCFHDIACLLRCLKTSSLVYSVMNLGVVSMIGQTKHSCRFSKMIVWSRFQALIQSCSFIGFGLTQFLPKLHQHPEPCEIQRMYHSMNLCSQHRIREELILP